MLTKMRCSVLSDEFGVGLVIASFCCLRPASILWPLLNNTILSLVEQNAGHLSTAKTRQPLQTEVRFFSGGVGVFGERDRPFKS